MDGGEKQFSPPFIQEWRKPFASVDMVRHAVKATMARNLPQLKECNAHDLRACIVAGGPSAEDTIGEMGGYIIAANGTHDWLIKKGVRLHACGLLCPVPWLREQITPRKGVRYFVASQVHGLIFDKLDGHDIVVWHASQTEAFPIADLIGDGILIPGGTSITLRLLDVLYVAGFRKFDFHGFDCSYKGERHHSYDLPKDNGQETEWLLGFRTKGGWTAQINDIFLRLAYVEKHWEPIEITMHGNGLMQHLWRERFGGATMHT